MEQVDFGNLAVQYAKKALNMKVIVVDINDDKLNLAKEVGADYAINSLHEDPIKKIAELTNGGAHGAVVSAVAKKAFCKSRRKSSSSRTSFRNDGYTNY